MGRHVAYLAAVLILLIVLSAFGSAGPKPWTTHMAVASNTTLRLHWIHVYEGFDTVTRIDAIRDKRMVRTFRLLGQPTFNEAKSFVALPNCWHGGCERQIRILDLLALAESSPIQFSREYFFEVAWESDRKLRVVLGAMNLDEKTVVRYFEVEQALSGRGDR